MKKVKSGNLKNIRGVIVRVDCPGCNGIGDLYSDFFACMKTCSECDGTGYVDMAMRFKVLAAALKESGL